MSYESWKPGFGKYRRLSRLINHILGEVYCVNFNQAALRGVFKPENMSWSAQAKQIPVRFVCVYASFFRRFQSLNFQSLFGSNRDQLNLRPWV